MDNKINKSKVWSVISILSRIIAYPFILCIIVIKYNIHAIINSICFLFFGGEWITYAKQDRQTINDIYLEIKNNNKK